MAGHGNTIPKPAHLRARRNKDPHPTTTLPFVAGEQPRLPAKQPDGKVWPARTKAWWAMWGRSPQAVLFTESDWAELLDTALLHARLWSGDVKVAAELRLRVAKFGATPEDRARLRIQFAQADQADGGQKPPQQVESQYAALRVVDALEAEATG